MANSNTLVSDQRLPGAAQGASSVSEFQFNNGDAVPAKLKLEGIRLRNRRFHLVASGRVTGGTTTNFTVRLFYGTDPTIGNNSVIFTSGAVAVNSVSGNWFLEAELMLDETSQKIQGMGYGALNGTNVAQAATTAVTGVDLTPTALGTGSDKKSKELGFTVSGQFSASHANNAAICDSFELEAL